MSKNKKAVVLLSGGLDSAVALAEAVANRCECIALTFNYQQRPRFEIQAAKKIAQQYGVMHKLIHLDPSIFSQSALVSLGKIPKNRTAKQIAMGTIPPTYVPGRNTLFLAYAVGQAEVYDAEQIYFGVNSGDSSPYPDSRPEYIEAYQKLINLATKQAVEGAPPQIIAPLLRLSKDEIIQRGATLKAPLHLTFSCYDPPSESEHCGRCDACYLRKEGFIRAGYADPTRYQVAGLPLQAVRPDDE